MRWSDARGRSRSAAIIAVVALGALAASSGVVASSAAWTDREFVASHASSLSCDTAPAVDARAWGRILNGQVLGRSLDPIASTDGITVSNIAPAVTSTGSSAAAPVSSLGNDAWAAALGLGVLSSLNLGAGITLPLDAGTGAYTQYGRATAAGVQTGAAGAVTTDGAGLASLQTAGPTTPRLGTLRLSSVLDSVLPGLGVATGALADVDLAVGAVGSVADLDGCDVLWNPASIATALDRDYLVASLDLGLTSNVVAGAGTSIDGTLAGLQPTLNGILTQTVSTAVVSSLTGTLTSALGGIAGVAVDPNAVSVTVTGSINLAPVRALLTQTLTDGVVSINLSTGRVGADLAVLVGEAYGDSYGLNGRAPNTSVLTPEVLNALLARVTTILNSFITTTVQNAVTKAIRDTVIGVRLIADLDARVSVAGLGLVNLNQVLRLNTLFSGTIGGFTGVAGYAAPSASTTVTVLPGAIGSDPLGLVAAAVNALLGTVLTAIVTAVATTVLPTVGSTVVNPIVTLLNSTAISTLATITGSTIPAMITTLRPVLDVLALLVKLTLNAQPDQPGSVGPPTTVVASRYFVSALQVGVVNGGTSLLGLWAASSSVGPGTPR